MPSVVPETVKGPTIDPSSGTVVVSGSMASVGTDGSGRPPLSRAACTTAAVAFRMVAFVPVASTKPSLKYQIALCTAATCCESGRPESGFAVLNGK